MLTPSNAPLWVNCSLAGNVISSGNYYATPVTDPEIPNDDSRREGTCAHWAGELLIEHPSDFTANDIIGMQHKNRWVIDREMAYHAAGFVEYCRSFGPVTQAEKPISLFGGLVRGRLDTTSTAPDGLTIRIFEFKYGWRLVEATKAWAALCYALAEYENNTMQPGMPVPALEMHIYQPRPYHPEGIARVWRIEAQAVAQWHQWLYQVACEARDNPRGTPGDQCRDCPAAAGCQALAACSYSMAERMAETRMIDHTANQLAAEIKFIERAEKIVSARKKALEAEAIARLKAGKHLPGLALDTKQTNRKWKVSEDKLELMLGKGIYDQVLKTPAEMEREGASKTVIALLTERLPAGVRLTLNPESLMDKIFGKVK